MTDINDKLRAAARDGADAELTILLSDPDCDALTKRDDGMTALMWAARYGHLSCVGLLLPKSDALAKSKDGMTALMWAARKKHEVCVGMLLHKSDALARDKDSMTALIWAAFFGLEACVRILLPVSDVQAKDRWELTASMLARKRSHESVAQLIDAYTLALSERTSIGAAVDNLPPCGKATPRV